MNNLFDLDIKIEENNSTEFIGRLKKVGFQRANYNHIANYPGGVGTAFNLIKLLYEKNVVDNNDSMITFLKKLNAIIEQDEIFGYEVYRDIDTSKTTTTQWMMKYYNNYIK